MTAARVAVSDLKIARRLIAADASPEAIIRKARPAAGRLDPDLTIFQHRISHRICDHRKTALPVLVPANCAVQRIIVSGAARHAKYVDEIRPRKVRRIEK